MSGHLTRRQVRSLINQMVDEGVLTKSGVGSGTVYSVSENYAKDTELVVKAIGLGLEELRKRGEIQ